MNFHFPPVSAGLTRENEGAKGKPDSAAVVSFDRADSETGVPVERSLSTGGDLLPVRVAYRKGPIRTSNRYTQNVLQY